MREYLLVFLVATAATYFSASLARRFAFKWNSVALVRDRDVHTKPVPYFGGLGMIAGLGAALVVALSLPWLRSFPNIARDVWGVFVAALVICLIGAIDDLIELGALAKSAGQVLAAGIVVMNGVRFYWIPLPDRVVTLDSSMSIALTVFVVLVCVNAINFMDGLDGLAAGVVGIGAAAFFTYGYLLSYEQELVRATTSSLIAIAIVGICVGFLPHNVHPARMFMGDSGSMLLGFLLACSMIGLTGQIDPSKIDPMGGVMVGALLPLLLPLAIMSLPFLDLISAYIRRTLAGKFWFQADKQHLHHRMLQRGHSHRRAVALLWLWSLVLSFGMVLIGVTDTPWAFVVVACGIAVAAWLTWKPKKQQTPQGAA